MKKSVSVLAVIVGLLVSAQAARADDFATIAINSTSAPTILSHCETELTSSEGMNVYGNVSFAPHLTIMNRARHGLIDATVEYRFYDRDKTKIGKSVSTYTLGETAAAGESTIMNPDRFFLKLSEPSVAVSSVTCQIIAAHFTGRLFWQSGVAWQGGPLSPAPRQHNDDSASNNGDSNQTQGHGSPAAVTVALGKAWFTNVPNNEPNSGTFVHVRVTLASPGGVDVWPAEFRMIMTLANGATKAYSPLQQPAPLVLRGGFLSYSGDPSQLSPSIAPAEDFGAIGKMSLQPNVGVTTVLTYRVDDLGGSGSVRSVDFVR